MAYALLLDNDPAFIIAAQKIFPDNTEWLATMNISKAESLVDIFSFDIIIIRKRNMAFLDEIIKRHVRTDTINTQKPFKKIIVLPKYFWRRCLRKQGGRVLREVCEQN